MSGCHGNHSPPSVAPLLVVARVREVTQEKRVVFEKQCPDVLCRPQETLPAQFLSYSTVITLKATTTVVFKDA